MDVTAMSLRAAAARPRVLLTVLPGGTAARLAAERQLRLRDWPLAASPAQADLLLVAGPDCPGLRAPLERLWQDLPTPAARVSAPGADAVQAALDSGRAQLGSREGQLDRIRASAGAHRHGGRPAKGEEGPGGVHDGHGPHGHGGMEMPGGLSMAGVGEDRDGLTLDQLHLPLGPFLADWPSGLTVHLVLQGDVIQQANLADPIAPGGEGAAPFWAQPWIQADAGEPVTAGEAARRRSAAHLDSLSRLLSVAGWPAQTVVARRLRDDLLAGAPGPAMAPRLERFTRRVGRSRTLAWATRGIGELSTQGGKQAGVSGPAARAGGDVTDRYRQWLADIRRDLGRLDQPARLQAAEAEESPRGRWRAQHPPSAALVTVLPALLTGAELAAARLIVASLDPDMDELLPTRREVRAPHD
ncbi:hypothetical protein [Streptomyces montanisoli]|uniref:Uncharacterized protein n=1 Tax=Streptomyces montanisoli TaxID=2798581 RepID=A0A940M4P1_9ACTN|nr:hypothetical protein [Streptomyces montanisoli]MBP0456059.1 hypothetical protein [Streptomyces montanisoli]